MLKLTTPLTVGLIALSTIGCASKPAVKKIGEVTYTLSVGESESGSADEAKRTAQSEAESFCASMDKSFVYVRAFTSVAYFSDEKARTYVLDFGCLDASDPEYRHRVLGQATESN